MALETTRPGFERLTVAQFHRMIELGILPEGVPVELIDGFLVRKDSSDAGTGPMTHGPRHAYYLQRFVRWAETVTRELGALFHVRQQLPLTLTQSEPEPDVTIVRGDVNDSRDRHPGAGDCWLVGEVSDGSLGYDRSVKAKMYAAAGIPVYILVNAPEQVLEIYLMPSAADQRYLSRIVIGLAGQHVVSGPSGTTVIVAGAVVLG